MHIYEFHSWKFTILLKFRLIRNCCSLCEVTKIKTPRRQKVGMNEAQLNVAPQTRTPTSNSQATKPDDDVTYRLSNTTMSNVEDKSKLLYNLDQTSVTDDSICLEVHTSNEVSPASGGGLSGCGDAPMSPPRDPRFNYKKLNALCEIDSSVSTQTNLSTITNKTVDENRSQGNSVSVEFATLPKCSDNDFIVRVSSTKSPLLQNKKPKMIGRGVLVKSVSQMHSAKVQTYPKVRVSATQSLCLQTSDSSLQTQHEDFTTANVQTSPTLSQSQSILYDIYIHFNYAVHYFYYFITGLYYIILHDYVLYYLALHYYIIYSIILHYYVPYII